MDNSTQQTELIMQYMDGEMSSMEKEEFERKLASDKSMQQELEDLRMARDAVKMFGLQQQVASARREMLGQARPQGIVRKMNNTRRIVRYTLSAAAGVLILAIGILAYNFFSLSPDRLYGEKYTTFELSALRGTNEQPAGEFEKLYQEKKYEDLVKISAQNAGVTTKDLFLVGAAHLELNQPKEAIGSFSLALRDTSSVKSVYRDATEYYLALSYLKTRNYEKALELMNAIHNNPSHLYHGKFTRAFIRDVKLLKMR